jgi:hypothetical protein
MKEIIELRKELAEVILEYYNLKERRIKTTNKAFIQMFESRCYMMQLKIKHLKEQIQEAVIANRQASLTMTRDEAFEIWEILSVNEKAEYIRTDKTDTSLLVYKENKFSGDYQRYFDGEISLEELLASENKFINN